MKKMFLIFGWFFVLFCSFFFWDIVRYNSSLNKLINIMSYSEMIFSILVGTTQAAVSFICFGFYAILKAMGGDDKDESIENLPLLSRARGATDTVTDPQEMEAAKEI